MDRPERQRLTDDFVEDSTDVQDCEDGTMGDAKDRPEGKGDFDTVEEKSKESSDELIRPSRSKAIELRKNLLMMDFEWDGNGFPNQGTGKPYKLTASAREIGRLSVGMGVYLTSLQLFIVLALFMTLIIGVPLMAMNATANNFQDTFLLESKTHNQTCLKPWNTNTFVLDFTIGNYCPQSEFSSRFDCPAKCEVGDRQVANNCSKISFSNTPEEGRVACMLTLIGENDTNEFYGPKSIPNAQLILLLFGQLFFLLWMLMLAKTQSVAADQINASIITAGDYSVMVKGLKLDSIENQHVVEFGRHYGEVANASHIATVGKPIELGLLLDTQRKYLEELKLQAKFPHTGCSGFFSKIYLTMIGGFKYGENAVKAMEAVVNATEKQLTEAQKGNLLATGSAIITFNYEEHAKNMLGDHRRSWLGKMIQTITFGMCMVTDAPRIRGRKIAVSRAPEPTDVWWENTWVSKPDQIRRRLISLTLTIIVMAMGAGFQFLLADIGEKARLKRVEQIREDEFGDMATSNSISLQLIPQMMGIVVVLINLVVSIMVYIMSFYERWQTRSDREKWMVVKLSAFYLTNSFMVPVLVQSLQKSRRASWYSKGGLMEQAFYIQLSNAVLPDLITLLDPMERIMSILSRFARSQSMMNTMLMPHHFFLAERYAASVKTLGLALFYMPALPISPLIAALGMSISYMTDKYIALRRTQKPHNLTYRVTSAINRLIRLLPLIQMILMWQLYFHGHSWAKPVFYAGVVMWVLFAVVPFTTLCRWNVTADKADWGTRGLSFTESIGKRARPTQSSLSQDMMDSMTPDAGNLASGAIKLLPEIYIPECPAVCNDGFKEKVLFHFQMPLRPYPPNPEILQGQKLKYGGPENVKPPVCHSKLEDVGYLEEVKEGDVESPHAPLEWPPLPNVTVQNTGPPGEGQSPFSIPEAYPIPSPPANFAHPHMPPPKQVPIQRPPPHVPPSGPSRLMPSLKKQGSFAGVPYYIEAQLLQQSGAPSQAPQAPQSAYPPILYAPPERKQSYKPYYPVILHTKR
ncbi:hypothetical protein BSKO_00115 [Bryopsis sp. KO-2023]|nr:hypothetical protein BSKO_00115 [Bryopsis sp. KO-2023]